MKGSAVLRRAVFKNNFTLHVLVTVESVHGSGILKKYLRYPAGHEFTTMFPRPLGHDRHFCQQATLIHPNWSIPNALDDKLTYWPWYGTHSQMR